MRPNDKNDFHMHTVYSDGSGSIDDMSLAAISKGLGKIAITDHMPLPFDNRYAMKPEQVEQYRLEIAEAQKRYDGRLQILSGLEIEYIPGHHAWIEQQCRPEWDTLICSIHHLQGPDELHLVNGTTDEFAPLLEQFDYDGKRLCRHYFSVFQEGLARGYFDIAGHLDVIKQHNDDNRLFDETSTWYRNLVLETLEIIAEQDMAMEINTGGFNHRTGCQYPSAWVIREAMARDIALVLSSDSHSPATLGNRFDAMEELVHQQL